MNWKAIAIASAAAAGLLAPAPALAQGGYSLRNDTGRTVNCRLERPHSASAERFALRPGEAFSRPAASSTPRVLTCDTGAASLRASLRPGPAYALAVDPETRRVAVRIVPGG
jgi:hypothetical protein